MSRSRVLADIGPLRESADFRRLYLGQLVSFLGTQLTVVAVPYQAYLLTDYRSHDASEAPTTTLPGAGVADREGGS
ncbi:MAG TPA: hypothetical protein VKI64_08260 [Acidimicrobiales bacterium]|nr:hypothetical protein [Acidimicrobiales bacterium]